MRYIVAGLMAGLLVVACHGDSSAPGADTVEERHVVDGPVTCDGCGLVEFFVAGPDLDGVIAASFRYRDAAHTLLGAAIEIRHFISDSGLDLQLKASFTDSVPVGEYDLRLDTVGDGGAEGTLTISRALKVTRRGLASPPSSTGTVRVTATTTGIDSDRDYLVSVETCSDSQCAPHHLQPQAHVDFVLGTGRHRILLSDIAANCSVTGPNPQLVTVAAYATTNVEFAVTCVALPPHGTVHITASTTGPDPDISYTATAGVCTDGSQCSALPLSANGSVEFTLAAGTYLISLSGVADNCTVTGPNPLTVAVATNATSNVEFTVTCVTLPPPGTARVTAPTTGPDPDASYFATVGFCDYYGPCTRRALPASGSVEFTLAPGTYSIGLDGIAANCSVAGPNPATVTVTAGATTNVAFAVTCTALVPPGTVRVTAPTTGPDPDPSYTATAGDCGSRSGCNLLTLSASGSVDFALAPGTHSISLADIAANCSVTGPNPITVTVVSGATTAATLPVTCVALGTVRVTTVTSGSNLDTSFFVNDEESCGYYQYGCTLQALSATGSVQYALAAGPYRFRLTGVAVNCHVVGSNPASVMVSSGTTTELVFNVDCD